MDELFSIESNLDWLNRIPTYLKTIYFGTLLNNGVINEIHNTFKYKFFRRKLVKSEYCGVWGWNSWCGIHTFPLLITGSCNDIYKRTVDVGFERLEPNTGLLPHAIIHKDGVFGSEHTYKCYSGIHNEAYNIDNILCWAKMAMEYYLVTYDNAWFNDDKMKIIANTIDFFLNNYRKKYNPLLLEIGIEGDWTECTNWELDNANVNVNMIETIRLFIECVKMKSKNIQLYTNLDYKNIRTEMITAFNKNYTEGGFWHDELGYYIHGNDGMGREIHGDKYFESTVNYFSILWDISSKDYQTRIWNYIDQNKSKIEEPYPVLTNYKPRTGTRRIPYGRSVTNGDIWLVLGSHAAAARLQSGHYEQGSKMFKTIIEYELKHGVIHNCIYQNGKVNDSWDPEVANYGAPFAAFVLGLLGVKFYAEGIKFNIANITGLEDLKIKLYIHNNPMKFEIKWQNDTLKHVKISNLAVEPSSEAIKEQAIVSREFLIDRSFTIKP